MLPAGTVVSVVQGKAPARDHALKAEMDVSDADRCVNELMGQFGMYYVIRGGSTVYFRSRDAVDVTPCTCRGRGVTYPETPAAKGGRGRCCLNCHYGKK